MRPLFFYAVAVPVPWFILISGNQLGSCRACNQGSDPHAATVPCFKQSPSYFDSFNLPRGFHTKLQDHSFIEPQQTLQASPLRGDWKTIVDQSMYLICRGSLREPLTLL